MKLFKSSGLLSLALIMVLTLTSPAFAASNKESIEDQSSTCACKKKDTKELSDSVKRKAIKYALSQKSVQDLKKTIEEKGYKLEDKDIVVKENEQKQINVVLPLYKSNKDYKAIIYNSTGLIDVINVHDGSMTFGIEDNSIHTQVYCFTCAGVCVGLIEIPPAFLSCVALCVALCA